MIIIPILHSHPGSKEQCLRLARYCKELDGTEIKIIHEENQPNLPYPLITTHAFKWTAKQMSGKPFVWLEPDSIPLKKGWLRELEEEYERGGKPFMLTSDRNPPHDLISGIGAYPPDAFERIPDWTQIKKGAWDGWMLENIPDQIHFTPLIQHSYGVYKGEHATHHRFPASKGIIRPESVLFHKDHYQDLIPKSQEDLKAEKRWTVSTEGDLGDSVILLNILSQIPDGPHDLILRQSSVTKMNTPLEVQRWHNAFAPLALAQPYVRECRIAKRGENAHWNSGNFRGTGVHSKSNTLSHALVSHLQRTKGIGNGFTQNKPWLTAEPSRDSVGRIIIARSARYRNHSFPWKRIVDFYGDKILFVGLPHEHTEFRSSFGMVEHHPVKDFLELAQLIAGSLLFIGNQSSPMTVAEGLKHPSIQETSLDPTDCIYMRENAQWVYNGSVTLPGFDKEDLVLPANRLVPQRPSLITTPPGQWQYHGQKSYDIFALARTLRKQSPEKTHEELIDLIAEENVNRVPEFFMDTGHIASYKRVEQARQNAGYAPRELPEVIGV